MFNIKAAAGHGLAHFVVMKNAHYRAALGARLGNELYHHAAVVSV
jgi:hypothetical protein